jgi:hypothetical protein
MFFLDIELRRANAGRRFLGGGTFPPRKALLGNHKEAGPGCVRGERPGNLPASPPVCRVASRPCYGAGGDKAELPLSSSTCWWT